MAAEKKCCVPSCGKQREDNVTLHRFPNPNKDLNRFRIWTHAIGGNILILDDTYVYNYRRVCHVHFEKSYWLGSRMLSNIAVPTLQLKGAVAKTNPLRDITNQTDHTISYAVASTSGASLKSSVLQVTEEETYLSEQPTQSGEKSRSTAAEIPEENVVLPEQPAQSGLTLKSRKKAVFKDTAKTFQKMITDLNVAKHKYAKRLKDALNLSKNKTFQSTLKKFTTLAALFTVMQFREIKKEKMGRRFTNEEKIMSLAIYKRGPRCYRLLRKNFVLPSPVTLSRMITRAGLKPGINDNIFQQLKRRANKMKPDDRLCTLIFDEMSITPHFDYNKRKDEIIGFVDNGNGRKKIIADHVLVFMIRGVLKNYKQPISYTFCSGSTKHADLVMLIKSHILKLKSVGFKVIATICDQGASNVSAINRLIEERRQKCIKKNLEMRHQVFEVDDEEIVPLYDVPHLMKGMRNNLLTKNLLFSMNGTQNMATWDHIINLYNNNPTYKGIRIIKKLTESHCTPDKIPKMKVKYATQIFSQTVGVNMGYLADQGILPVESKQTADFIIFMDGLFDSMNGSFKSKNNGKPLLQALTPTSAHRKHWIEAKSILKSMRFVNKSDNKTSGVPSIKNWISTIENMEYLRDILFNKYDIKSIWCRHFNQDPLENFFGTIRSHGYRNNSPTCTGFEAAFASLLVNNLSSNYSVGSNCEQDSCYVFKSLKKLFFSNRADSNQNVPIDFNDVINDEFIVDINIKKRDPRIFAALEYVTGYVLSKLRNNVFKNCKNCKENLFQHRSESLESKSMSYIKLREFNKNKDSLCYPSEALVKCFSEIQDITNHIIKEKSCMVGIKKYIKLILDSRLSLNFMTCEEHKLKNINGMFDITCNFFLCNWCRDSNKLICGTKRDFDQTDVMQGLAFTYCNKRRRKYVLCFIDSVIHPSYLHIVYYFLLFA